MQIIHHDRTVMGINVERLLLQKLRLLDVLDFGSLTAYLIEQLRVKILCIRGTQRGYSSKPLNIALLNVF